ncbi:MAG: nucleotide sugar dehydrogenase [Bacteroidia bacterium]
MHLARKIGIIGLGYVGLPLAMEFAKTNNVVGFDIDRERVAQLKKGEDYTLEADLEQLVLVTQAERLLFTSEISAIQDATIYIVTVPTPIDHLKVPNLKPLLDATAMLGRILKRGDLVIYESTVYPGCTEEDCVPILEKFSGLKYNEDFYCGYSPERINPGDKINTLTTIKKVTSGSTEHIAKEVDALYQSIITAGTHLAPSIKVAEASKAIENAQRDINISFVNELALIFDRMEIDTSDVLAAAATKWNFLPYKPGLVGGHCIGVDPYYLAHKAESLGYKPEVILSGRRVNEQMGIFVANKVIKMMIARDKEIKNAKVLLLGITFKENCPDIRNTRVVDIYNELLTYSVKVDVYDPWANSEEVEVMHGIKLVQGPYLQSYDAIILAVQHQQFSLLDYQQFRREGAIIFDTKSFLIRDIVDARL